MLLRNLILGMILAALCACEEPPRRFSGGSVKYDVYTTGGSPNRIRVVGGVAYITTYSDNRVEYVDLSTCTTEAGSCTKLHDATFETNSGPYDVAVDEGSQLLFSSLGSGKIGSATLTSAFIGDYLEGTLDQLDHPQGLVVAERKLYVSNAAYTVADNMVSYNDAFISVFAINNVGGAAFSERIELPFKNPDGIVSANGLLYVTCSGARDGVTPISSGGVVIIDPQTDSVIAQIDMGLSAPGPTIALHGSFAYVPSALGVQLYKINISTHTVERGLDDPIVLSDAGGFASSAVVLGDYVYAASFSEDIVYAVDSETDELVDVDTETDAVDSFSTGPGGSGAVAAASYKPAGGKSQLLILNTISNSVSAIALD